MKILYSTDSDYGDGTHTEHGLVTHIHFQPWDENLNINDVAKKIKNLSNDHKVILVPFAHLDSKVLNYNIAENLFILLTQEVAKDREIFSAGFWTPKWYILNNGYFKIQWEVEKGDAEFKFRQYWKSTKHETKNPIEIFEIPKSDGIIHQKDPTAHAIDMQKLYDKEASNYDKHMNETHHFEAQETIVFNFQDHFGKTVLDLATWTGHTANTFILFDQVKILIINDISKNMLTIAKDKLQKTFMKERLLHLWKHLYSSNENIETEILYEKIGDAKIDTVFISNLLAYMQDKDKLLENVKKILKQWWKLIILEEYPFLFPKGEDITWFSKWLQKIREDNNWTPEKIINILERSWYKAITQWFTEINEEHNLYWFVFELQEKKN